MAVDAVADSRSFYQLKEKEQPSCVTSRCSENGIFRTLRVPDCMESLLCDSEGVELFNQFLRSKYSCGHLLDFWFACKGFRSNVDPGDSDKLFQVAKVIYRTYIKGDADFSVPLPVPVKHDIVGRMSSYHRKYKSSKAPPNNAVGIDRTLFDVAQHSIMSILEHSYFPKFVDFVNGVRSPQCTDIKSSEKSGVLPSVGPASYVTHEKSLRSRMRWRKKSQKVVPEPPDANELGDNSCASVPRSRPSSTETCGSRLDFTANEETRGDCFPPSEERALDKKPNKSSNTKEQVRGPLLDNGDAKPGQNLAETDPATFVLLLTSRLEKVKESRGKMEKLLSWVNQVDEKCLNEEFKDKEYQPILHEIENDKLFSKVSPSHLHCSPRNQNTVRSSALHTRTHSTVKKPPNESKAINPIHDALTDEDAQNILDDHCSRIWADDCDLTFEDCKKSFASDASNFNRMAQSSYVPGKFTDPVGRRHCATNRTAGSVSNRRRMSLSATNYQRPQAETGRIKNDYRYRTSDKRSSSRSKRSDVRSTASWDSGVVDNCPLPDTSLRVPENLESETKSLVAAASLQALSSSTTELAIVNSEVTAQLVERMTRHYSGHQHHRGENPHSILSTTIPSKPPPFYRHCDPCCHIGFSTCNPANNRYPPVASGDSMLCSACRDQWCSRIQYHSPTRSSFITPDGQTAHPTVSDTSSTFDSGISSTYDKLPLITGHPNPDGTSRRGTTYDWPVHRFQCSMDPHGHMALRTSSTSRTNPTITLPPSNKKFSPNNYYPMRSNSTIERNSFNDFPGPPCAFGQNNCMGNSVRPTGQLLQCWLQLQTSNNSSFKQANAMGTENGTKFSEERPFVRQSQHSRHSSRRPAVTTKSLSVCSGHSGALQGTDKPLLPEYTHKTLVDSYTLEKDGTSNAQQSGVGLIVGYYLCDDPVPYRTVWMGPWSDAEGGATHQPNLEATAYSLTLGQFKQLIAKKGIYRYFFKKPSDEFGTGAVHEELTDDNAVLPLWDGKVVARIERAD